MITEALFKRLDRNAVAMPSPPISPLTYYGARLMGSRLIGTTTSKRETPDRDDTHLWIISCTLLINMIIINLYPWSFFRWLRHVDSKT